MNRAVTPRLPAALTAVVVLLVACTAETTPTHLSDPIGSTTSTSPTDESRDFVLLRDDDDDPDQVRGEAGTYALTARGATEPALAVVDVPEGFANFGEFGLWPENSGDGSTAPFRALQYWTVFAVHEEPCRSLEGATEVGASVEDLVDALASQKMTTSTPPKPVSLDGHDGVYVELATPAGIDFERCDQAYFMLWEGKPGDAQHTAESPGLVERLWVLDVAGERVVLSTAAARGVSKAEIQELTTMVESVRFAESD